MDEKEKEARKKVEKINVVPSKNIVKLEISREIVFNRRRFNLKAAVEERGSHFIAHIKRPSNTWEQYDDCMKKISNSKNKLNIVELVYVMDDKEDDFKNYESTYSDVSMKSGNDDKNKNC